MSEQVKKIEISNDKLHKLQSEVEGIEEMNNMVRKAISIAESESKAY